MTITKNFDSDMCCNKLMCKTCLKLIEKYVVSYDPLMHKSCIACECHGKYTQLIINHMDLYIILEREKYIIIDFNEPDKLKEQSPIPNKSIILSKPKRKLDL